MSTRYTGGIITKNPQPLNPAAGNAANGVFTMEQYTQAVRNGTWPAYDPYFNYNTLLLHGNGTNGAQNNTFLDSSTNNFTITRNGDTTQGTFSPFSREDGNWSYYFDATTTRLAISNATLALGTGDFTISLYYYRGGLTAAVFLTGTGNNTGSWSIYSASATAVSFRINTLASDLISGTLVANAWNKIEVTRTSGTLYLYVNDVLQSSTANTTNFSTSNFGIGSFSGTQTNFGAVSYISNLTIIKAGTVVLDTCKSNRFLDSSSNNFTFTVVGTPRVTPVSPFPLANAYTPTVNGGSAYFDGSGDYLSVPDNAALEGFTDFTIEFWINLLSVEDQDCILTKGWQASLYAPYLFLISGTSLLFYASSNNSSWDVANAATITTLTTGQFYHIAVSRDGANLRTFANGTLVTTVTNSTALMTNASALTVFANASGAAANLGYISGLRITNTAVYTASFTPPTAPPTAISGTALLLNFTNAGILDSSGFNNIETEADAQIDTSVKKFGDGSMEFDGTGDFLSLNTVTNTTLHQIGNWTYEGWIYWKTLPTTGFQNIFGQGASGQNSFGLTAINGVNNDWTPPLQFVVNQANIGNQIIGTTTIAVDTWYHFAVVRSNGVVTLYVNGVSEGTYSNSTDYAFGNDPFTIGNNSNCYIDDFRFTQGFARYTTNFTPQTSQWQDQ